MTNTPEPEPKQGRYMFFGIVAITALLLVLGSVVAYPLFKAYMGGRMVEKGAPETGTESSISPKSPDEYYAMFKCSCCGQPIDSGCCGMAKEREAYVDKLLLDGLGEREVLYQMVKKFGFDVLMDKSREQEVRDYVKSKAPDNPPRLTIDNAVYDFGTVKQSDGIVTTLFEIKNTGKSDLIIDSIDTSCMCTSAALVYKGQEGPKFGMSMHGANPADYELIIPPGETAQLKVYYDPMAHGKQDKPEVRVTREVTIISNDPADFQKKVRIDLNQVR